MLNGEKLIPLRPGTRQGCVVLPLPFYILLEILTREGKGNKRHADWEGIIKLLLFEDDRYCL